VEIVSVAKLWLAEYCNAGGWLMQALDATFMLDEHVFFAESSLFLANVATGSASAAHTYFVAAMSSYSSNKELQARCSIQLSSWDAPCALAMLMLVQGSGDYTSWMAIQLVTEFVDAFVGTEDQTTQRMVGTGDVVVTPKGARCELDCCTEDILATLLPRWGRAWSRIWFPFFFLALCLNVQNVLSRTAPL
jgi:hypothetical protein